MDWDTVVVGSGIGGLTAAVALARAGQRVLILEQHYLPGGWSHSFTLEGHRFSPGVHYVGELGQGESLRNVLEGLGVAPHLRFRELSRDGYDHMQIAGERYDLVTGRERQLDRLTRRFPPLARGLARYFSTCRALLSELQHLDALLGFPQVLAAPLRAPTLARWGVRRLSSLFDACRIDDPMARAILSGQCGNHGLAPDEVSLPAHAAMIEHYVGGAYYPRGGAKRIVSAYLKALRAHGGAIRVRTRVTRILIERGRAIGVELESGERLRARRVISNADAALTYETLVPASSAPWQRMRAARARPSVSALSLFVALDMDLGALGYDSGNYWWYRHADVGAIYRRMQRGLPETEIDALFIGISSLKDPHLGARHHTLEMFTFVPWAPFERWKDSASGARAPGYEALKRALRDQMLAAAEHVIPGLRAHVTLAELGTPLTNDFYCASRRGGCYGIAKTPLQVGPFGFSTRSPIRDLYLCGASTFSHGVAGAALSGLLCARDVLDLRDPMECLAPPDGSLVIERDGAAVEGPVGLTSTASS